MAQTAPLIALSEITNRRGWLIDLLGASLRFWVGVGLALCGSCYPFPDSSCSITQSLRSVFSPLLRRNSVKQASLAHGQSCPSPASHSTALMPTLKRKPKRTFQSSDIPMATSLRLERCPEKRDHVERAGEVGGRLLYLSWRMSLSISQA